MRDENSRRINSYESLLLLLLLGTFHGLLLVDLMMSAARRIMRMNWMRNALNLWLRFSLIFTISSLSSSARRDRGEFLANELSVALNPVCSVFCSELITKPRHGHFAHFLLFRSFCSHSSCALDASECKLHATSSAANVYLSFGHRNCVAKLMKFIFVRFIKSNLIFCVNQNALIGLPLCVSVRAMSSLKLQLASTASRKANNLIIGDN